MYCTKADNITIATSIITGYTHNNFTQVNKEAV